MRARARLIARSHVLRGLKVNAIQKNPHAGVARIGDEPPPGKKRKKKKKLGSGQASPSSKKKKKKRKRPKTVKGLAQHRCSVCGRNFGSSNALDAHRIDSHLGGIHVVNRKAMEAAQRVIRQTPGLPKAVIREQLSARVSMEARDRLPSLEQTHVACPKCGTIVGRQALAQHIARVHREEIGAGI